MARVDSTILTESDVRLIRQAKRERDRMKEQCRQLSNKGLARKFQVTISTIEKILAGTQWKEVA